MEPIIIFQARNLKYNYPNGHMALKGVTLSLKKGKKTIFMGANGSGKSTFFLCLTGLYRPQSGELFFHNAPLNYSKKGLLHLRSQVGIVFQEPDNQLFLASALQDVAFGPINMGFSTEEACDMALKTLKSLHIDNDADQPTHSLSGGQKKLVSIADILVMNPEVIIMDEPGAALDPIHAQVVYQLIEELSQRGITLFISTHDVNYAYEIADEIVLFHDGKVLAQDSPVNIFRNPKLLQQTNLKTPDLLSFYQLLVKKGIIEESMKPPRNLAQLKKMIPNFLSPIEENKI